MSQSAGSSIPGRRDRTGGIVRDKLDLLMIELEREKVPQNLVDLAQDLQKALDEKFPKED
ncbi:hypothetical protein ASE36_16765 [Rhizobium sp. Root274]|uniref:hypothetical protein n=1 Tax=unclassified Rhizobium TaxID=2613769 RepID=UPI000712BD38|nr:MULTISPECIES: hypothetical protein [unclassified Rhizobium]KQW28095.1 hypothetical protein ASC71_16800 [Rhizobium sp. Root1240]KRD28380.1 hypothetical protein ASE36_16765 [Rhizobium sp. Root274]